MTELVVHVEIAGVPVRAGIAYFTAGRQRVSTTFVYDSDYLGNLAGFDLEPGLRRQSGQQYVDNIPGIFQDCSPDRWGRNLITKQRRAQERSAGSGILPALTEVDFLLGVSDLTRQGDLRFSSMDSPAFLAAGHAVPKLVSLPTLLDAADHVAADGDDMEAIKILLDAGSGSLGGARPKASVVDEDGALLLAKFPHRQDEWDVTAWEKWALDLAESAGIQSPARRLTDVGGRSVLLLERFDRGPARVGYISAMTMLGRRDGDDGDYIEIAQAIPEHGANVNHDLRELYRRMAFNVAIHNTDDHLRNHGFLRAPGGWILSPVFDLNPHPVLGRGRATGIGGAVGAHEEVEALREVAIEFRLTGEEATEILTEVVAAVRTWREVASRNRIPAAEQDMFGDIISDRLTALAHQIG